MSKYTTPFYKIYNFIAKIPSKISWSKRYKITEQQRDAIAKQLASGYYIILTGSDSHLSSIIVSFLTWVTTGRWARYSHVLMNCDNIEDAKDRDLYKFVEATAKGVDYATFEQVFSCDRVCLLTPKNVSNEEWTKIIDTLINNVGKPYDDLFDLADDTHQSCVELVLDALESSNYHDDFKNLAAMIEQEGNLVPEMYRDCPDFIVAAEY